MSNQFGKPESFDVTVDGCDPTFMAHGVIVSLDHTDIRFSVQRTPEGKPVLVAQTTDGTSIAVLPAGANTIGIIGVP